MANNYFTHFANIVAAGTRAQAAHINNVASEIEVGLDKLPTEIQLKEGRTRYAVDSGVADAYVITLPHLPTLTDGFNFIWKATNANTGPATINVNGLGAKSVILASGGALVSGDIIANQQLWCSYESVGDNFRLLSQSSSAGGGGGNAATVALLDESADTTNFVTFANNATGNQALFSGTNLTFNSATGDLAAILLTGTIQTAAQPNITSLGTIAGFTSTGIDDNATGERLQLADTALILGAAGVNYEISHAANDREIVISGGSNSVAGANIQLHGGIQISFAQDMSMRAGVNTWMNWDESVGGLEIFTGVGVKTSALEITVAQDFDMHGHIRMDEEASVAAPTAGKGRWWVRSDAPNVPMFTNDADVDFQIGGGAITFPATQVSSADANTLDDYEEGTFTPTLQDISQSDAEGQTYTTQEGNYTKIGNVVYIQIKLTMLSLGTLNTGNQCRIANLPFTVGSRDGNCYIGRGDNLSITAGVSVHGIFNSLDTEILLFQFNGISGVSTFDIGELSADGSIQLSGFYFI